MVKIADEKLNAFLDGELPETQAVALESALEVDHVSAERLDQLSQVDALLRGAVDRLALADPASDSPLAQPADVANIKSKRVPPQAANDNWWRLPLTASVALMVGLISGSSFFTADGSENEFSQIASFDSHTPIGGFLEAAKSGEQYDLGSSKAEVRITFMGSEGNPCREFVVEGTGSTSQAVACRSAEGVWRTELVASAPSRMSDSTAGYQTASDQSEAFGQAVSSMMQSDALGVDAETMLIEGGWQD